MFSWRWESFISKNNFPCQSSPTSTHCTVIFLNMSILKNSFQCQSIPIFTHCCLPEYEYTKKILFNVNHQWQSIPTIPNSTFLKKVFTSKNIVHCLSFPIFAHYCLPECVFKVNKFQLFLLVHSWRSDSFHLKFNFQCRRQSFPNFPQYCLPGAIFSTF